MQNAWRFVADEALQERLKEAKGIGTPATRAEIIRGLKTQEFLVADGKHIVPTERGLALFAVLERADPALVDPGVTAQMERLLDDVLVGQQDMVGAIDAVCAQASRIIDRLQASPPVDNAALLGGVAKGRGADRPPTPAMKQFVDSLARQKGLPPPRGYTTSSAACRTFLDQHAPDKDASKAAAGSVAELPVPAAAKRPRAKRGATGTSSPRSKAPRGEQRGTPSRKTGSGTARAKRTMKTTADSSVSNPADGETPLRIPFGNKEAALQLGARYRAGGWYAPPGVDLDGFRERGWL